MGLDSKVSEALYTAVKSNHQPDKVAKMLINWLTQISEGNLTLDKPDDTGRPLDEVLIAISIKESEE